MSDFTVVKCKKCDAALTQLEGEVLTSCVQCGYKFPLINKAQKQNLESVFKSKTATPEVLDLVKKLKQIKAKKMNNTSPEVADVVKNLKQRVEGKTTQSKTSKTKTMIPTKKKSNPIGTIIFWIILISIIRGWFSH
jgi:predicted  nucleic acid-binding Zn-ribbon protein